MEKLTVDGTKFRNESGHEVILQGINFVCKEKDKGYLWPEHKKLFSWFAQSGFNLIRLGIFWDGVEPKPGIYDDAYLGKIGRVIEDAEKENLYVLVDMHQDLWSVLYADGAPEWATLTDGAEHPSDCAMWFDAYLKSDAIINAADHFWKNDPAGDGIGLMDHYAAMWKHIVKVLDGHENIIGYEPMNEPFMGSLARNTFGILQEKYREKSRGISETSCRPAVISTSSIALQEAIMQEYIPFLSRILLEEKLIRIPLKAAVRKGKEHFVCDSRLEQRLLAIRGKRKNEEQRQALRALRTCYDMDQVHGLSGFDRRLVCVPRFCPGNCLGKETCRYHRYMERAKGAGIHFQICNHNYLLADASHRAKGYRPLLSDYRALVVDEAHKLPEAAGQMCGKTLCHDDILELCFLLEKEHQGIRAGRLKSMMKRLFQVIAANHTFEQGQRVAFRQTEECVSTIKESAAFLFEMGRRCRGSVSKWIRDRLEEAGKLLCCFLFPDRKYILFLEQDPQRLPVFCTASREVPAYLQEMLWNQGVPAILTSGTLKAGAGFGRTRQMLGLSEKERKRKPKVEEYVAESPFEYKRNCMLYLPQDGKRLRHGSREEAAWIAEKVKQLTCATHGHTLVLFTSYSLMGSVYQLLRKSLSFPLVEVWRHTQEEIMRFKKMGNAVLFAAGSCWEGVDFPGDRVSSLIIVRLPFAVPDPVREAEKERYGNLREYIDAVAVPDMQKKLRQGFGRAIRTETDTCVVTILDHRAARGGRYYEDVLSALPPCEMAESIEDVGRFIGKRKNIDYYM